MWLQGLKGLREWECPLHARLRILDERFTSMLLLEELKLCMADTAKVKNDDLTVRIAEELRSQSAGSMRPQESPLSLTCDLGLLTRWLAHQMGASHQAHQTSGGAGQ